MLDVLIQTHNEELNLPHTLASISGWAHRIFVVDSGSTDRTREIAENAGAIFIKHGWLGYARQKNWALDTLPFESPWILILDADESVSPELKDEISWILARPARDVKTSAFYINRVTIFMGRQIHHSAYFPAWNLRLFKRGMARYEEREVHEHMVVNGPTQYLRHLLFHEDRRGLEHFIAKHNRYSTLEAMEIYRHRERWPGIRRFVGDRVARRRYVKYVLAPKLGMPWFLRFVYMYFVRGGIMDGRPGLTLCLMISTYELFIRAKYLELMRTCGLDPSGIAGLAMAEGGNWSAAAGEGLRAMSARMGAGEATAVLEAPVAISPAAGVDQVARALGASPPVGHLSAESPLAQAHPSPPAGSNGNGRSAGLEPRLALKRPASHRVRREESAWSMTENIKRVLWMMTGTILFRPSFHNWYAWRRLLLRIFGAKIGRDVRIRPTASIEIPWNLDIADEVVVGDYAILYSLGKITIGRRAMISQYAHLCAGTHDYTTRRYPLLRPPITIGEDAWIAADAFVGPGVTVGDRSVVGARATVVRDVEQDMIVVGPGAKAIKHRLLRE